MKRINLLKVSAIALLAFSLYACEPSTPEGKAEKFNKMVHDAKKLEQEGKSDLAEKKKAVAAGYFLKVLEEYGDNMDRKNMEKFGELTEKID